MSAKLQVYDKDMEMVKMIMEEFGETLEIKQTIACPNCNSNKLMLKLSFSDKIRIIFNYVGFGEKVEKHYYIIGYQQYKLIILLTNHR